MNRPFPINQFPSLPRYLANDTQIADVPYRLLSADLKFKWLQQIVDCIYLETLDGIFRIGGCKHNQGHFTTNERTRSSPFKSGM